jgi:large subunit ribosomal protein L15
MKLHDLKPNPGKTKNKLRAGRGTGGRRGKTAGRGTKGSGARAGGGGRRLYRQGGNLPFFRRLPFKRGFTPPNQVTYNEVNLDQLEGFKGSEVSPETLGAARLLREPKNPIVIMGRGEIKKALKVRVHRVTDGARKKIEAAGGSIELIRPEAKAEG